MEEQSKVTEEKDKIISQEKDQNPELKDIITSETNVNEKRNSLDVSDNNKFQEKYDIVKEEDKINKNRGNSLPDLNNDKGIKELSINIQAPTNQEVNASTKIFNYKSEKESTTMEPNSFKNLKVKNYDNLFLDDFDPVSMLSTLKKNNQKKVAKEEKEKEKEKEENENVNNLQSSPITNNKFNGELSEKNSKNLLELNNLIQDFSNNNKSPNQGRNYDKRIQKIKQILDNCPNLNRIKENNGQYKNVDAGENFTFKTNNDILSCLNTPKESKMPSNPFPNSPISSYNLFFSKSPEKYEASYKDLFSERPRRKKQISNYQFTDKYYINALDRISKKLKIGGEKNNIAFLDSDDIWKKKRYKRYNYFENQKSNCERVRMFDGRRMKFNSVCPPNLFQYNF